jgi:hypothetical protein
MPAHSTYQMQLLDVSLFGLLSTAYTNELNKHIFEGLGMVLITKYLLRPRSRTEMQATVSYGQVKLGNRQLALGSWHLRTARK